MGLSAGVAKEAFLPTADKALALIDAQVFDAAMLDMNMSGSTSLSVADALIARGVPFIYCSGNNSQKFKDVYHDRLTLKKPLKQTNWPRFLQALLNP